MKLSSKNGCFLKLNPLLNMLFICINCKLYLVINVIWVKCLNYWIKKCDMSVSTKVLGVVKRNPLFFHSISCKNNRFLFTTSNITQLLDRFLITNHWQIFFEKKNKILLRFFYFIADVICTFFIIIWLLFEIDFIELIVKNSVRI